MRARKTASQAHSAATKLQPAGVALPREGRAIFDGLSLTLTERRVGRNAAGKSQLLRLIAGLAKAAPAPALKSLHA